MKLRVVVALVAALGACSSPVSDGVANNTTSLNNSNPSNCPEQRLRCVDDVPEWCDETGWNTIECDYLCVEEVGCAIEAEPSQQCVEPDANGWCVDGNPTGCVGEAGSQYLVPQGPCLRGTCYSFLGGGFCVESPEPDARCDAILENADTQFDGEVSVGCTDGQTVACVDGRVIIAEDCSAPNECRGGMCGMP